MSIVITTVNVNGIRAAVKQRNERNEGMLRWLSHTASDDPPAGDRASHKQAHDALAPALARAGIDDDRVVGEKGMQASAC